MCYLQLPLPLAVLRDCINLIAAHGTNMFAPCAYTSRAKQPPTNNKKKGYVHETKQCHCALAPLMLLRLE